MKMKKLHIIFLLLPIVAFGQITSDELNRQFVNQVEEQVVCFTDRNLYLSGEQIWFSSMVMINDKIEEVNLSNILFAELFDRNTKRMASAKFLIEENRCSGSLQIPPETLSGGYFIRFYTKYQRNQSSDKFAVIPLTIINTELTLPNSDKVSSGGGDNSVTLDDISIKTDASQYKPRSLVKVDINFGKNFDGYFCITAARTGTIEPIKNAVHENTSLKADTNFLVPDVRGLSLSGFVRDKQSGKPMPDVPVFFTAFDLNNLFHISKTKSNGSFLFALNKMEGQADVFLSIDPSAYPNTEVLINNDFSGHFATYPDHQFIIDSSYKDLLAEMLVNFETKKIFAENEQQPEQPLMAITNLPTNYDFSINLNDFIDLASLQEVFYEIVPPISVKTDKAGKYLAVANYQTQHVSRADLIILDDVPVFNVDELLKISPVNIASIEVINRPYYLGDNLLKSIVSIKTKTGDFGGYKFPPQSIFLEYQALSKSKNFTAPDFSSEELKQNPYPDFRTTMFWHPFTELTAPDTTLSFYTSDAKGEYDIIFKAVSKNGEIILGSTSIVVE